MATTTQLSRHDLLVALAQTTTADTPENSNRYLLDAIALVNRWLARGDGVALYRNEDLSHPELGHTQIMSFGSPQAQLEVEDAAELPDRLPDIGTRINWRYWLVGYYKGEAL